MNLDELENRLNKISSDSKNLDNDFKNLVKNISEKDDTKRTRQEYYDCLSDSEREYQKYNDIYKDWINSYSKEYIEMSEFYVGEELPREHYLQSKKDVIELYKLFMYYGMMEHYLNILFKVN
mgnify:CR=1 FL=1